MRAAANSTPLIHLSKAGALKLLLQLYDEVVVPEAVYEEVVVRGLERGFREAGLVEAAVKEGSVKVERAPRASVEKVLELAPMLHRGEAEVLALALRLRPCHVLLDDRAGRAVAHVLGLEVHGTLYVLIAAAARGYTSVEEALDILDRLVAGGFRVSIELYLETRRRILNLTT